MTHKGTVTLETERLILRRFTSQDAESMYNNWASDDDVTRYLMWDAHASADETQSLIQGWLTEYENAAFYNWAIELREIGEVIGSIQARVASETTRFFDIGYSIGVSWWHRGIMTEAFGVVIKLLFEQVGANRVQAQHRAKNPRSGLVMQKCGLTYEGTLRQGIYSKGEFHDVVTYAILSQDYFAAKKRISPFNLRQMRIIDYDSLYALWMSTPGMGLNNVDDSREGIAKFLSRNPMTCFVAERESEIVGAIMAGHDGRRGHIHHTTVREDYRRGGIGSALVTAAMDALKAEGITKVSLVAFERNELGNAFWEAQGFTVRPDLTYRNKAITE